MNTPTDYFYRVPDNIGAIMAMIERNCPRLMKLGGSLPQEGASKNRLKKGALNARTLKRIEELWRRGKTRQEIADDCQIAYNTACARVRALQDREGG